MGDNWGDLISACDIFCSPIIVGSILQPQHTFGNSVKLWFSIFVIQTLKGKIVRSCIAKLGETSVIFGFKNETKTIHFNNLTSYKSYYGSNGPILYLKNNIDNFKIFANNNFCKTDDSQKFCEDIIIQLDKYKDKSNSTLIHEGSIYATKGFLYFLIIATLIYLLAFIFENKG